MNLFLCCKRRTSRANSSASIDSYTASSYFASGAPAGGVVQTSGPQGAGAGGIVHVLRPHFGARAADGSHFGAHFGGQVGAGGVVHVLRPHFGAGARAGGSSFGFFGS